MLKDAIFRLEEKVPYDEISSQADALLQASREEVSQCVEQCGELRRRYVEKQLAESNEEVKDFMKFKFAYPPDRNVELWEGYNAKILPADDLEKRLDNALQRAGNRPSISNCLRLCSERIFFVWGMACFTALCWLLGIERGGGA